MDASTLMKLERRKSVIKAIAELEIALNTFYGEGNFSGLEDIYNKLKEYKEDNLD